MTYSTIRNRSADKFKKKKRNKQNVFIKKTIVFSLYIKLLHNLFGYATRRYSFLKTFQERIPNFS